jgi:hypothetical protein
MKKFLTTPSIFTPGNSGIGTIKTNIINFDIRKLIAIVNQTREQLIYGVGANGFGYTSINGDTITLEFNTTGYSSGDILNVIYDSSAEYPIDVNSSTNNSLLAEIKRLIKISETLQVVDSAQRQRVTIDAITGNLTLSTVSTIGTLSTVTNVAAQTSLAGMDREMYINIAKQTYALAIRVNLRIQ